MQSVSIRWMAWYGDKSLELKFPDRWKISLAKMYDASDISDEDINKAFLNPIGSKRLSELAKNRKDVVIAADDISRPTPLTRLLPFVIGELEEGGISRKDICIIVSSGGHRPSTRRDFLKKYGEDIVDSIDIQNHHPFENLVNLGKSKYGTPIFVNKFFMEGDFKIGMGCITPHAGPGFTGGGKIVLPGIAGIETLEYNHRPNIKGISGGLALIKDNKQREDIEEIALKAGLEFIVNVVVNSERGIAGIFVGHPIEAHRKGVELAKKVFETELPQNVDVGFFNAYPKDTEFMQCLNALNIYFSSPKDMIKENGTIVIISASPEGRGFHSLHGKGMRLPIIIPHEHLFGKREIYVFSPYIGQIDLEQTFFPQARLFKKWSVLMETLKKKYTNSCHVAVFPCGPLQIGKGFVPGSILAQRSS